MPVCRTIACDMTDGAAMVLNASSKSKWSTTPTGSQRTHVDHRTFRLATGSGRRVEAARRPVARSRRAAWATWARPRNRVGSTSSRSPRRREALMRCRVLADEARRDRRRGRPLRLCSSAFRDHGTQCTAHRHRRSHARRRALGRIEPGVSGTVMAGSCMRWSLKASGSRWVAARARVGTAGHAASSQAHQRMAAVRQSGSVREYVANAFRDHAELLTAASTVAVTVSASLVLTLSAARTHERSHERCEARPCSRAGRGACATGSGRRCFPHDANTRLCSLPRTRADTVGPKGAEPR